MSFRTFLEPHAVVGKARAALKRWIRPQFIPFIRAYLRRIARGKGGTASCGARLYSLVQGAQFEFSTDTFFGATLSGNTRDLIQRFLFYFGIWEPDLTGFVGRTLGTGDTFVDVGANIGYFTLYAAHLVGPSGRVVAVEASPSIFRSLQANLDRNHVTNVRSVNVAAVDRPGTLRLFRAPESNVGQTSLLSGPGFVFESDVAGLPLAAILSSEEVSSLRLLKIDVEGAEWLVLSGMQDVLANSRFDLEIVVELSPAALAKYGKTAEDVFTLLGAFGFVPYRLENDYSPQRYCRAHETTRPVRIRGSITEQTDVVFSRRVTEAL